MRESSARNTKRKLTKCGADNELATQRARANDPLASDGAELTRPRASGVQCGRRLLRKAKASKAAEGCYVRQVQEESGWEVMPDGNVHTMPLDGPEHTESAECWCEPELIADETEGGGVKCYLHKEIQ